MRRRHRTDWEHERLTQRWIRFMDGIVISYEINLSAFSRSSSLLISGALLISIASIIFLSSGSVRKRWRIVTSRSSGLLEHRAEVSPSDWPATAMPGCVIKRQSMTRSLLAVVVSDRIKCAKESILWNFGHSNNSAGFIGINKPFASPDLCCSLWWSIWNVGD